MIKRYGRQRKIKREQEEETENKKLKERKWKKLNDKTGMKERKCEKFKKNEWK
jgi:hypothetical protein